MALTQLEIETMTAVKNAARKIASKEIDWENRRYELVKQLLPSMRRSTPEEMVDDAIVIADLAIKKLRKTI